MSGFELKWIKPPKPEALSGLPEVLRDEGIQTLKEIGPEIYRWITDRLHSGRTANSRGEMTPVPPYTRSYIHRLRKHGRGARPDYDVSGTLLRSLKAKVSVKNGTLVFELTPSGRISEEPGFNRNKSSKSPKAIIYNAHLANWLSRRIGFGAWGPWGTTRLFETTLQEREKVQSRWSSAVQKALAARLHRVAGG